MVIWIDFVDRNTPGWYWIDQHFDTIEELVDYVFSREVLIVKPYEDDRERYAAIVVDKITEVSAKF